MKSANEEMLRIAQDIELARFHLLRTGVIRVSVAKPQKRPDSKREADKAEQPEETLSVRASSRPE
jgi:hypothetical protein